MGRIQLVQPSFANGFARSLGESAYPEFWPNHAWVPAFGPTGATLLDLSGGNHGTIVGSPAWVPSGLFFDNSTAKYVNLGSNNFGITATSGFTIVSAIHVPPSDTGYHTIITKDVYVTNWYRTYLNDRIPKFSVKTTAGAYVTTYGTKSVSGNVTLAFQHDGLVNRIFSASEVISAPNAGELSIAGTNNTLIGLDVAWAASGTVMAILIYNKALSLNQVKRLQQDPFLPFRRRLPVFYSVPSAGGWTDATCLLDGFLRIIRKDTDLLDGKVAVQSKATKLLDGKAVVLSKATNLLDGKTVIKDTTTNLLDGKVAIKDTVSRLLDGKVIIKSSATKLLDGKLFIQSGATKLLDGKVVIKDTTTNLLDGLVIVSSAGDAVKALDGKLNIVKSTTTLLDGKVVIQYTAEDMLDGKLVVKNTTTNMLDGKAAISNLSTSNLDGIVTIKDTTTNSLDGKVVIKDIATRLLDGKVIVIAGTSVTLDGKVVVKSETSTVVDGKVVVKDTTTTLLDGALFVTTGEEIDLLDGKVSIIKTRPNHLTNAQVKALIEGITHKDPVPQSSAINVRLKSKSGKQSNTATVIIEPDE